MELVAPPARPDESLADSERHIDLSRAMAGLQPAEQDQWRRYLGLALSGMGPDEAARALAVSRGESFAACKKRLQRIRRKLKDRLSW